MGVPFRRELDDLFQSDGSILLKMGGAGVATAAVVIAGAVKFSRDPKSHIELSTPLIVGLALGSLVLGAVLALALSLKDVVRRRIDRGKSVSPLLRLFFGGGRGSLALWFVLAIFLVMAGTAIAIMSGI